MPTPFNNQASEIPEHIVSLSQELRRILGSFDFRRPPVVYFPQQSANRFSETTALHEMQHYWMCRHSSHGLLQIVLAFLCSSKAVPAPLRARFDAYLDASIVSSFVVHEGIATLYQRGLVARLYSPAELATFWEAKPDTYRSAVEAFDSIMAQISETTLRPLAFELARHIAMFALNSAILEESMSLDTLLATDSRSLFLGDLDPDARLAYLLSVLDDRAGLSDLADRYTHAASLAGLDAQRLEGIASTVDQIQAGIILLGEARSWMDRALPGFMLQKPSPYERMQALIESWRPQLLSLGCSSLRFPDWTPPATTIEAHMSYFTADFVPAYIDLRGLVDHGQVTREKLLSAVHGSPHMFWHVHLFDPVRGSLDYIRSAVKVPDDVIYLHRATETREQRGDVAVQRLEFGAKDRVYVPSRDLCELVADLPPRVAVVTSYLHFAREHVDRGNKRRLILQKVVGRRRLYLYMPGGSAAALTDIFDVIDDESITLSWGEVGDPRLFVAFQEVNRGAGAMVLMFATTAAALDCFLRVCHEAGLDDRVIQSGWIHGLDDDKGESLRVALHWSTYGY